VYIHNLLILYNVEHVLDIAQFLKFESDVTFALINLATFTAPVVASLIPILEGLGLVVTEIHTCGMTPARKSTCGCVRIGLFLTPPNSTIGS
jgi:hypothetical protein